MNSNPFEHSQRSQATTPEELAAQASELIVRASGLHGPYVRVKGVKDRSDELTSGPGYLSRLQKTDNGTVNIDVTSREAEGNFPTRTMILKETGLGVLTVEVEGEGNTRTVEGTFTTKEDGIGEVELDSERAMRAANTILSALEDEIVRREIAYFEAFLEG